MTLTMIKKRDSVLFSPQTAKYFAMRHIYIIKVLEHYISFVLLREFKGEIPGRKAIGTFDSFLPLEPLSKSYGEPNLFPLSPLLPPWSKPSSLI